MVLWKPTRENRIRYRQTQSQRLAWCARWTSYWTLVLHWQSGPAPSFCSPTRRWRAEHHLCPVAWCSTMLYFHAWWLGAGLKDSVAPYITMFCSHNRLTPNDSYMDRTAPLTSKRCILYIYSTNTGTEYFKHALYSTFFSLQNTVCFIMLTCLVPVLFTFYI